MDAQKQLRTEIHAAIKRLGMESDLTFYQASGFSAWLSMT